MKKVLLCLVVIAGLLTITGCSKNNKVTEKENKKYTSIVISDVDKDTRWEAISNYDITLEFENDKCVSENYRLEFLKESNAIVYGIEMEGKTYIYYFFVIVAFEYSSFALSYASSNELS